MPPQACELFPPTVGKLFCQMQGQLARGERDAVARGCEETLAALRGIEAEDPDPPARRKVARAYLDLALWHRDLERAADAQQTLGTALDRWAAVLRAGPNDFYARTQLAACHNHLGLIAAAAKDWGEAEDEYLAALDARWEAFDRHPGHEDECLNMVYLAGVNCNLGHLHADRGDDRLAAEYYEESIKMLSGILPPESEHKSPEDAEVCDFFVRQWEWIYGTPHPTRVARQFLANARDGRDALARRIQT